MGRRGMAMRRGGPGLEWWVLSAGLLGHLHQGADPSARRRREARASAAALRGACQG